MWGTPLSLAILSYEPNRKLNGVVKVGSLEFAVYLMTLERAGTDSVSPSLLKHALLSEAFCFYGLTS